MSKETEKTPMELAIGNGISLDSLGVYTVIKHINENPSIGSIHGHMKNINSNMVLDGEVSELIYELLSHGLIDIKAV